MQRVLCTMPFIVKQRGLGKRYTQVYHAVTFADIFYAVLFLLALNTHQPCVIHHLDFVLVT